MTIILRKIKKREKEGETSFSIALHTDGAAQDLRCLKPLKIMQVNDQKGVSLT